MTIKTALLASAVALAALIAVSAGAQVGPVGLIQMPPLFGDFRPVDGAWVEYKVVETDSDTAMEIKIAVIGHEKCQMPEKPGEKKEEDAPPPVEEEKPKDKKGKKGKKDKSAKAAKAAPPPPKKDCYWVEVVTQLIDGPSAAVKIYSEGDPRDVKNIRRLLNRAGKRQPVEAKPEALAKLKIPGGPIPKAAKVRPKKDVVTALSNNDKIMSTIYEFHSDSVPYVVWSSDRVPIFGVAKLQAPNLKIDVMNFGRNYKSTFPDLKQPPKKDDALDKPGPLDIKKPKQGQIEEVKDKLQDDYKRPDLESVEPATPQPKPPAEEGE